jgi:hypothetical protein
MMPLNRYQEVAPIHPQVAVLRLERIHYLHAREIEPRIRTVRARCTECDQVWPCNTYLLTLTEVPGDEHQEG